MLGNHDEAGILQQIHVEHALVDRAVAEHLDGRPQIRRHRTLVEQFGYFSRTPECLEGTYTAADEITDHRGDQAPREPSLPCPDSTPSEVRSTASALTGPVGKLAARGTARGGA